MRGMPMPPMVILTLYAASTLTGSKNCLTVKFLSIEKSTRTNSRVTDGGRGNAAASTRSSTKPCPSLYRRTRGLRRSCRGPERKQGGNNGKRKTGTKAVGSIVKIKVNGASKDFIVVQQGNPNTGTYDSSCAGTWLLMKDIYTTMKWDGSNNDYKNSDVQSYLNGTFYNLIDSDIRNAIKQVKIPYQNGTVPAAALPLPPAPTA